MIFQFANCKRLPEGTTLYIPSINQSHGLENPLWFSQRWRNLLTKLLGDFPASHVTKITRGIMKKMPKIHHYAPNTHIYIYIHIYTYIHIYIYLSQAVFFPIHLSHGFTIRSLSSMYFIIYFIYLYIYILYLYLNPNFHLSHGKTCNRPKPWSHFWPQDLVLLWALFRGAAVARTPLGRLFCHGFLKESGNVWQLFVHVFRREKMWFVRGKSMNKTLLLKNTWFKHHEKLYIYI